MSPSRLLGLAVALGLTIDAAPVAANVTGSLVLPPCTSPPCPTLQRGFFRMHRSMRPGANGVLLKAKLVRATEDGIDPTFAVSVLASFAHLPTGTTSAPCDSRGTDPILVATGRLDTTQSFATLVPPGGESPDALVAVCNDVFSVSGPAFEAVAGVQQGGDRTKLDMALLLNPACTTPDCPIDALGFGRLSLRGRSRPIPNAVEFRVRASGATLLGVGQSFMADVTLSLRVTGAATATGCEAYTAPVLTLTDGAGQIRFTGADLVPPLPDIPSGVVQPCGAAAVTIVQQGGTAPTLVLPGLVQGDDADL